MPRFVVYEVWTRHRIIDAADEGAALDTPLPDLDADELNLANWHAVQIYEAPTPMKPVIARRLRGPR